MVFSWYLIYIFIFTQYAHIPLYYIYKYEQYIRDIQVYKYIYSYKDDHVHKDLHIPNIHAYVYMCIYQIPIPSISNFFPTGWLNIHCYTGLIWSSVQIISLFSSTSTKSRFRILGRYNYYAN